MKTPNNLHLKQEILAKTGFVQSWVKAPEAGEKMLIFSTWTNNTSTILKVLSERYCIHFLVVINAGAVDDWSTHGILTTSPKMGRGHTTFYITCYEENRIQ